jgi:hypothetical protein
MKLWEVANSGYDGIAIVAANTSEEAKMVAVKARFDWVNWESEDEDDKEIQASYLFGIKATELIIPDKPARLTYYYE